MAAGIGDAVSTDDFIDLDVDDVEHLEAEGEPDDSGDGVLEEVSGEALGEEEPEDLDEELDSEEEEDDSEEESDEEEEEPKEDEKPTSRSDRRIQKLVDRTKVAEEQAAQYAQQLEHYQQQLVQMQEHYANEQQRLQDEYIAKINRQTEIQEARWQAEQDRLRREEEANLEPWQRERLQLRREIMEEAKSEFQKELERERQAREEAENQRREQEKAQAAANRQQYARRSLDYAMDQLYGDRDLPAAEKKTLSKAILAFAAAEGQWPHQVVDTYRKINGMNQTSKTRSKAQKLKSGQKLPAAVKQKAAPSKVEKPMPSWDKVVARYGEEGYAGWMLDGQPDL